MAAVTAAARQSASRQFLGKDGSVTFFMGFEFGQLGQQSARAQSCGRDLPGVDVHGAMLARVIDLDDASCLDD